MQLMDSQDRAQFFAGLQPGGKYEGIIGVYRHNTSADRIGIFDAELVAKLPSSVKWIAHNGAGYDQIDVVACKQRGKYSVILITVSSVVTLRLQEIGR